MKYLLLTIALVSSTLITSPVLSQNATYYTFELDFSHEDELDKTYDSKIDVKVTFTPVTKYATRALSKSLWYQNVNIEIRNNSCFNIEYNFRFQIYDPDNEDQFEYYSISSSKFGMKSKSSSNNHFKRVSYNRNKVSLKTHTIIPLNGYRIENEQTIRCLGYESKEIYQSLVRKKEAKEKIEAEKERQKKQNEFEEKQRQRRIDYENQNQSNLEWLESFDNPQDILDFYKDKTTFGIYNDVPLENLVFAAKKMERGIIVFNSFNGRFRQLEFNITDEEQAIIEDHMIVADYSKNRSLFDKWIHQNNQFRFGSTPTLLIIMPSGEINILYSNPTDYMIVSPLLLKNYIAIIKASIGGQSINNSMVYWDGNAIRKSIHLTVDGKLQGFNFSFDEKGTLTQITEYEKGVKVGSVYSNN